MQKNLILSFLQLCDPKVVQRATQKAIELDWQLGIPVMQAVWAPMDQALNDAISGKKSAKQALQDATDTIKNAINAQ